MFKKMIKQNFLRKTLAGVVGFFGIIGVIYLGWSSLLPAIRVSDHSFPVRNFTGVALTNPEGIAVDAKGNVWMTNYGGNSVTQLDPAGKPLSPSTGYTGGGLNKPMGIAVDYAGNVWVANYGNNSVTQLDPAGKPLSPSTGYTGRGVKLPFSLTVDTSGNVWVANEGNSVTELIGAALPDERAERLSGNSLNALLNKGEDAMETLTVLGAEMLHNELTLLKIIVGVGFLGWMGLLITYGVLLTEPPAEKSKLDEYGCHFSKIDGGYSCITGQFAGRTFADKKEMLKLAA
jgi:streptogramin lyase